MMSELYPANLFNSRTHSFLTLPKYNPSYFQKIEFPSRISRIGDFTRGQCSGIQGTHVYTLKIKVLARAPSRDSDYIPLPSEKGVFYIKCPLIFFSLQTVLTKDFNSIQSRNKSIKYRGMVFIHYYHQIKPNANCTIFVTSFSSVFFLHKKINM